MALHGSGDVFQVLPFKNGFPPRLLVMVTLGSVHIITKLVLDVTIHADDTDSYEI